MATRRKRCLKGANCEQTSNVLMKKKVGRQAEDLANQAVEPDMEPLPFIKTEDVAYHTNAEAHALPEFTPVPQTDEYIKTELMLDEEYIDDVNESEPTGGYDGLPLADDQQIGASISAKQSAISHLSSHSDSAKDLQKGRVGHPERRWKCELCPGSFKTKTVLRNHRNTHNKDRKREIACDSCDRKFYTRNSLWNHKKVHAPGTYECQVCRKRFTQSNYLTVHMRSKHLEKAQSTTPARQKAHKNTLNPHQIVKSTRTKEATFQCEFCSRSFKTKYILKSHLNTHDKDRRREFACDLCDGKFYSKSILWSHKKVHTRETYLCKVCGKRFTQVDSLKVHMLRRQHVDETQEFTPQSSNDAAVPVKTELISSDEEFIDERSDKDVVSLAAGSQQPVRSGTAERSVSCEVCHNSYPAELIETHMRITHSDRTFKCEYCAGIFLLKADLKRHIRSHDDKDNRMRPHACEQCGRKFIFEEYLKRHIDTQHTKNRKPQFNCELCEKLFYTKAGLKRHMKAHTGVTVSCEVCGARFTREQSLTKHMARKHTAKAQAFSPEPPTANDLSVHTKEELISDEQFLDEEMH